jgi:hypothetical protein
LRGSVGDFGVDSGGSRELTTIASCSPYFSALHIALLVDSRIESQVMVVNAAIHEW